MSELSLTSPFLLSNTLNGAGKIEQYGSDFT